MERAIFRRFLGTLLVLLLAMFVAGSAFAQGKGHGNGNGKHGGGNPGENGQGRGNGGGKHGGDGGRVQMPQQYQMPPQYQVRQAGPPAWAGGQEQGKGHGKKEARQVYSQPQRQVYIPPQQVYVPQQAPIYYGYKNRGQQRAAEVHARNAERKAIKEQQKAWDRQQKWFEQRITEAYRQPDHRQYIPQRSYQAPYYSQQPQIYDRQYLPRYVEPYVPRRQTYSTYIPQYQRSPLYTYDPYYSAYQQPYIADQGFSGKDVLRQVIFAVLTGVADKYIGGNNDYGVFPAASYQSYAAQRYFGGYQPVSYAYRDFGSSPYVGGYADPYNYNSTMGNGYMPVYEVAELTNGGDFFGKMLREMLAVGYTQGYNDGLAARAASRRDAYYNDPYVYDYGNEEIFDPYSASLGSNRRCLSQGYDLGYQDALANDRYAGGVLQNGDLDLVSVLLSSLSSLS